MSNLKTVITFAAVSVTTLFGLLWLFQRKKPPSRKKLLPVQETSKSDETGNSTNYLRKPEAHRDGNNSADDVNISTNDIDRAVQDLELEDSESISNLSSQKPESNNESNAVIVEQISAITEPTLSSQKVNECSVTPVNETEPVIPETISSKTCTQTNSLPDSIMSQIIGADVNHSLSNDLDTCVQDDSSSNGVSKAMNSSESIIPEISNQVNISPELNKSPEPINGRELVSQNSAHESVSETLNDQQMSEKDSLGNDTNAVSNNDSSPMSRSWHEDVEESEKNNTNGCLEQNEIVSNDTESCKESSSINNHVQNSSSPLKKDPRSISNDRSSASPPSKNSSPVSRNLKQVKDGLNHSESSSNCDNSSETSTDSGKGGSFGESQSDKEKVFEFNIPTDLCGLFIGTRGKTIKQIRDQSGARIRLKNNPYTREFQICVMEGTESVINRACKIVKRKFPAISIPGIDTSNVAGTVIMPEIMQLNLPESVSIDVVVSSIVDAGRLFLQQPTHPSFPSLERLNSFMNQCYHHDGSVPDIPKPIESGVICAAPMLNGWYRAQIMMYYEDTDECDIKYVDYGGYSRISSQCLKQIRSDFMTLPFEAIECYLANVTPLDNESYFSPESGVVLEELTQGKMLQAQVVGKAEDGIPYIHLYQIGNNGQGLLVNRELVNRGVVRWLELLS